jgi:hypothetical protein
MASGCTVVHLLEHLKHLGLVLRLDLLAANKRHGEVALVLIDRVLPVKRADLGQVVVEQLAAALLKLST